MGVKKSESDVDLIRRCYGKMDAHVLADLLGCSYGTLQRYACRMGLAEKRAEKMVGYVEGDVFVVPLHGTKYPGKFAYVSPDKADLVSPYRWFPVLGENGTFYARARIACKNWMIHQLILQPPKGKTIDHKDGDGLNNRDDNIRVATYKQNGANKRKPGKVKGVHQKGSKWVARVCQIYLGSFATERDAGLAYDRAALEMWGEFACLNYPDEVEGCPITGKDCLMVPQDVT